MKKFIFAFALASMAITPAVAEVKRGAPLFDAQGKRIGVINRILADGSITVIVKNAIVTIPASTLSDVDGKIVTPLTRSEAAKR